MEFEYGETKANNKPCLETIRALHQTVVALRTALEQSRNEILELKQRAWPVEAIETTLRNLSIENQVLRNTVIKSVEENDYIHIDNNKQQQTIQELKANISPTKQVRIISPTNLSISTESDETVPTHNTIIHNEPLSEPLYNLNTTQTSSNISDSSNCKNGHIEISIENLGSKNISKSLENLTKIQHPIKKLAISKTLSFSNISSGIEKINLDMSEKRRKNSVDSFGCHSSSLGITHQTNASSSPNISQMAQNYVQSSVLKNSLETAQSEPVLQNTSQTDLEQNEEVDDIELIFTTEETKDSDFKEELVPIENNDIQLQDIHNNSMLHCPVSDCEQSLSDRELDDDVFHDSESQENSNAYSSSFKRENSHLYNSKSDNSINPEDKSLKSYYSYQDSSFENKSLEKDESFDRFEEQIKIIETDISKCGIGDIEYAPGRRNTCPNPLLYRPIIHREAVGKGLNIRKGRPILCNSNNARRESGVQTDISALPNSSWRSESSLNYKARVGENFATLPSKFLLPETRLRLSEKTNVEARRILLSDIGFTSMVPELSRSADHLCPGDLKTPTPPTYGQFLRATDLYSPGYVSQKFTWTATTGTPSEASQIHSRFGSMYPLLSPPPPSRRFSAPVSPSRRVIIKPTISKVRFSNGSLPELRSDWDTTIGSGDSTDSLVEEAENYLRRSIDCIVNRSDISYRNEIKSRSSRRASAPEPTDYNVPPQDWQPFLPRHPHDLHLDHWVKVIVPEGKVRGGRVRYIGPLLNQMEQFVGVQLSTPDGHSDGTYNNRRYFICEPYHSIFVPFKKVVMGWRP